MTTEQKLREALAELREWHKHEYQSNQWIDARVDAALALPVFEVREEWRVAYEIGNDCEFLACRSLEGAMNLARALKRSVCRNVRIESRTVSTSPWVVNP